VVECTKTAVEQTIFLCKTPLAPGSGLRHFFQQLTKYFLLLIKVTKIFIFEECVSLIHLPIHDYLQLEGEVIQSMEQYASHKGIHTAPTISTPEDFHPDEITKELTRLQTVYVNCQ
jgi:hypothetical protein